MKHTRSHTQGEDILPDAMVAEICIANPEAGNLFTGIDTLYKLDAEQLQERGDALTYIHVLSDAHAAGHGLMQLSGSELASLRTIAAIGCERPALWAQNILCFGYGECYAPCTSNGASQRALHLPSATTAPAPPSPLTVYPNPASSYVTLAYTLADAPQDAVLVLLTVDGREVKRMPISSRQGQQLVDTRGYAPGTYSVELLNDGARLATRRLVVKP